MHFRVAAFPASCSPQLAKVQHLKATGRRPPRPATPAPVRADRGFQLLPPSTLHPVLHVRLFALLEEKEEPDPKEGISKVGGRGACRPTTEATSPDTIHSVGWDHHGGQGSKLGEDTDDQRSGQERAAGARDGARSGWRGESPPVVPWPSPCWGEQRAWRGLAGHAQRTRAIGSPKVSVSPTVAPLKRRKNRKRRKRPRDRRGEGAGPQRAHLSTPRPARTTLGRGRSSSPPGAC